jgi:RNA polymerase sigma-70 factor (ECF subfamily)
MGLDADQVIAEHGPALARVAASYERDRALREELTQEILLAVARALPRLAEPGKLKPFVFRIAHNRAVSHVARRVREPAADGAADLDAIASETASQEQALIAKERSAMLLDAVRALKLPYRQVITLVLEDLTYEEIAEALGLTVTNVGVRVNRAKQQLKAMLHHER